MNIHHNPPYTEPRLPATYPIEDALEQAYANLPGHTDDGEYLEDADGAKEANERTTKGARVHEPADAPREVPTSTDADSQVQHTTGNGSASLSVSATKPEFIAYAGTEETADPAVPETLHQRLEVLPKKWMARFVLGMYENGGEIAVVCKKENCSLHSIRKAMAAFPHFAEAMQEAVSASTGYMKGSLYLSATMGDLKAIYRGPYLVGYERVKSTKAAELLLRCRGELGNEQASQGDQRGAPMVPQISDEQVPAIVSAVVERLFSGRKGRPVIDAETVPEPE